MAKARHPHTPIYISRTIDTLIDKKIRDKEGKVLFVHGDGGFGKSTLLRKYVQYGEHEKIPLVFIDLKEQSDSSMVSILLDEGITFVKNCPKFQEIRTMIIDEPQLLSHILNTYSPDALNAIKRFTNDDENYQQIVGTIMDGWKVWTKFTEREREAKKKAILTTPEFLLVKALSEDLQGYGLCIIDTFEKIKMSKMVSKINFLPDGTISARTQEKYYSFKTYIEGLIYLMVEHTTFIIAGRNRVEDLSMELPLEEVEELSMEQFSFAHIEAFFAIFAQKHPRLGSPTHQQLATIEALTQGNALLIDLFSQIAQEYPSWEALDYPEMERRVRDVNDKHGLLFYFTDRITSHLRDEESELLWKLVIPRVLTQALESQLFGTTPLLEKLVDTGLVRRGLGREAGKFYPLDNVHSAILNHFEKEYRGKHASWHDNEAVKALHLQLIAYYDDENLQGINSPFEACYHRMMARTDFEREFKVKRERFAQSLLGALRFSAKHKKGICEDWETLDQLAIEGYIKTLSDEKSDLQDWMSSALYDELSRALALGNIETAYDSKFLEALSRKGIFSSDWSLFYLMGSTYANKGEYDRAIQAYQKAVAINPQSDQAYNNMGVAYDDKGEYDRAIQAYQKAVAINPQGDEAYTYMGIAYGQKEDYDRAIQAFQKAVAINPQSDQAYYNMGVAYGQKEDYDHAIEAYQKAVELNPQSDDAYYNMGNAYYQKEEYDHAIEAYQKAVELNPQSDQAYTNM